MVLRSTGAQLGNNYFDFYEHATVPWSGREPRLDDLDRMHRDGELDPVPLRAAIADYTEVFSDTPPVPASVADRTESRVRGTQRGSQATAPTGSAPKATPAAQQSAARALSVPTGRSRR
ncbi:hypothetical protein [Kitasatospora sp. NPDC098663]|uniref:hypothetical protein n=1 Tax=Kitasatospora sp. NPDC098663 TaxID=3364096 RepID=UPI003830F108